MMKLSLRYKFILSLLILTGFSFFIYFEDLPPKKTGKQLPNTIATPSPHVTGAQVFDPDKVSGLTWMYENETIQFTKNASGVWEPLGADWAIKRRLGLISKSENILAPLIVQKPLGHLSLNFTDAGVGPLSGSYDDKNFVWDDGPYKGKGYSFENDHIRNNMFAEGLQGFHSHHFTICTPEGVEKIQIGSESLIKEKGRILIFSDGKVVGPPNRQRLDEWLKKICELSVEYFAPSQKPGNIPTLIIKVEEKQNHATTFAKHGDYFYSSGLSETAPFRSEIFEDLTKTSLKDFVDEGFIEAKTILDARKSEPERIQAIRNVKRLKSNEAVPALGKIITGNTVPDDFRYEAIDALIEIGTKNAYKVIAEGLGKVGPSGTQVRLARALAQALGAPLNLDEKTSKSERRLEIQRLLSEYKRQPPGT